MNTSQPGGERVHDESTDHTPNPSLTELRKILSDGLARVRLTKTQLAARAGLGRTTVQQAFRADGPVPSAQTVAALARGLTLPVDQLLQLQRDAARGAGGGKRSGSGKPIGEWDPHAPEGHRKVSVSNEINRSQIQGPVLQAHTIHGDVRINSGWGARGRAEMVTAWTGPNVDECAAQAFAEDEAWSGYHFHSVVVHNGGPQPIHDVVVSVPAPTADLLPGEQPLMLVAVGIVPPGERHEVEIGDSGQFEPQFAVPLELCFSTADGSRWRRDEEGQLSHQEVSLDTLFDVELTPDQRSLITRIAGPWLATGNWPVWGSIQPHFDARRVDADELFESLPRVGVAATFGAEYGFTTPMRTPIDPGHQVRLTVAACCVLPELRMVVGEPFVKVLRHMVKLYTDRTVTDHSIAQAHLRSAELTAAMPELKPWFVQVLPDLLSYEPAIDTSPGGVSFNDGRWEREITRSVMQFRDVQSVEDYIERTCELVTTEAAANPG